MRQVILYPGEDGYWVVECPSLAGCFSQGRTKDVALTNIKEAIQLWVDESLKHNEPVPGDIEIDIVKVEA